jgi:LysM repeat protein
MRLVKIVFLVFALWSSVFVTAQNNGKHTVKKGETVFSIAKQYQITPFDIYRLNPDAKNGIQENTVLLLPQKTNATKQVKEEVTTHVVAPKETLFSLAKKYEVSVADLKEWNPTIAKNGLKIGEEIIVRKDEVVQETGYVEVAAVKSKTETFSYKVQPQETKYGIAKKFNITIEELEKANPQIKESLSEGEILTIKRAVVKEVTKVNNQENFYTVKPQETLFGLSKELNLSQDELIRLNPELQDGLKEGMVLKLPKRVTSSGFTLSNKPLADLTKSVNKSQTKDLVLLLPFGLNKIQSDSTKTQTEILKTNKFLNMTLDFYAGAMMAIDSAKVLGLPVNVKILDIESTKNTSNVASVIAKNDFSTVSAVIGPFQTSHTETAAQLLSKYNTPVISPLSKEVGRMLPNLYYSVPSQKHITQMLFTHFEKNNGNVIAIISAKKGSSKDHISANYPNAKFASYNEKGGLDFEYLRTLFVKGQKNFVVLDSENRGFVLNVTNHLIKLKSEFDLQLAVLELYDTLDFEEIPITNLTELNMLFPSTKKEVNTPEGFIFESKFKKANGVSSNSIVNRGFDVTFDTLLRICQEDGFTLTTTKFRTEHVESSFDYTNENGANVNTAGYLLYYDTDLTIKQVQ